MKIEDLPVKLQTVLTELSSDSGWLHAERQIGFMLIDLPVMEVLLSQLPVVSAYDFEDYSLVGALLEKPSEALLAIYAHGKLLDGKPSLYAAMCRNERRVKLVDASKIVPEAYAREHGWAEIRNGV